MSFIVMQRGWNYNDSFYTQEDGGHPIRSFKTKQDAEKEVDRLTINRIFSSYYDPNKKQPPSRFDLGSYIFDLEIDDPDQILNGKNFKPDATPVEILSFLRRNSIEFYYTEEIEDCE